MNAISNNTVFLLRYSNYHAIDTIAEHKTVLLSTGNCWFGKIGKKPQLQYLEMLFKDGPICLFLFTKYKLTRCVCTAYSYSLPPSEYLPPYYFRELLVTDDLAPSVYFKLESMEDVPVAELEKFVVKSSGKPILDDLNKSISSFYTLADKETWTKQPKKKRASKVKPSLCSIPNSCIYRSDGNCTNKRCVSYQFECEHPSNCIRQKPIPITQTEE